MLQIQHVSLVHRKDLRTIVDDVSFSLQPGDKAVVIGEEGDGKSTLLKWIYDPALVHSYAQASGKRILHGNILGYLPQELTKAEKEMTIYEYYCHSPVFFDRTPKEMAHIAGKLSLPADFCYGDQPICLLSGGEKVKMQLARILMEKPDILLLDEPSNDMDIDALQWLEQFINQASMAHSLRVPRREAYRKHCQCGHSPRTAHAGMHRPPHHRPSSISGLYHPTAGQPE